MTPFNRCLAFLDKHGHYRVGQIVEWYNGGWTDKDVAQVLGVSRPTWTRFKKVMLSQVYVLTEPMENALSRDNLTKSRAIEEKEKIIQESRSLRLAYSGRPDKTNGRRA